MVTPTEGDVRGAGVPLVVGPDDGVEPTPGDRDGVDVALGCGDGVDVGVGVGVGDGVGLGCGVGVVVRCTGVVSPVLTAGSGRTRK